MAVKRTRQELESKILEEYETLAHLKRQINILSPINRLPNEVLSYIFLYYSATEQAHCEETLPKSACGTTQDAKRRHAQRNGWMRISHVCHLWREVALSCAKFWTLFYVTDRATIMEVLARSKSLPLDIRLGTDSQYGASNLVLEQSHRIRQLEMSLSKLDDDNYHFPAAMPELQGLHLQYASDHPLFFLGDLADRVLDCGMPRLKWLSLTNFIMPWRSPLFRFSITHLDVTFTAGELASLAPSLGTVLETLEGMPHLEHLALTSALPGQMSRWRELTNDSELDPVRLAKLRSISIMEESGGSCITLLHHLIFPADASIRLKCSAGPKDIFTLSCAVTDCAKALETSAFARRPWSVALHSISPCGYKRHIRFQLWTSVIHPETMSTPAGESQAYIDVTIICPYELYYFEAYVKFLITRFPWARVESLYLSMYTPGLVHTHWVKAFKALTNMRSLHIAQGSCMTLAYLLEARMPVSDAPIRKGKRRRLQPLLPSLEELTLRHIQFRHILPRPEDWGYINICHRAFGRRAKILPEKFRLKKICLVKCKHLTQGDIDGFAPSAEEVSWDGLGLLGPDGRPVEVEKPDYRLFKPEVWWKD